MINVHPSYYPKFKCIAEACRHNCCIGWEIDIDPDTAKYYKDVDGAFGKRLKKNIQWGKQPHFILGEHERCPFLNSDNLCDIILTLGEEHICTICTEHPRFHNELPGRIESGLGLCCEEAARLVLSEKDPVTLIFSGEPDVQDNIVELRDKAIEIIQDRNMTISERIDKMLSFLGASMPDKDLRQWSKDLLSLEQLDYDWTTMLSELNYSWQDLDIEGFDEHMADRQTEYEQLLVYFIYRHMANAPDEDELRARACFAALGYVMIHALGAMKWTFTEKFTFKDQVELARLYSSEIEYSEENTDALLDMLYEA